MKPDHAREKVGEKAGDLAQERALGLHAPQLLEEGEGDDLRVRESLESSIALPLRIEVSVCVVYEAEQNGECVF
ncbi:MAG TPA: hypothetical protein VJ086_01620 [Rubrobacteraceae bacterium]|nr:hypothetical protein [Rubrobacteraceae bacterium]